VPATVPNAETEAIRRAVESGAHVELHPLLKCGVFVRVKCGPLVVIQGILVWKKDLYRLVLSVEMLKKAVSVKTDVFLLDRLNGTPSGVDHPGHAAKPQPQCEGESLAANVLDGSVRTVSS
jgi:hypothetical protein